MAITEATLRQAALERAALNAIIDQQDAWVQQQIRGIMASIPMPAENLDAAGLQAYLDDCMTIIDAGLERIKKRFPTNLMTNKARAIDLAQSGTERMVLTQLPGRES